MSDDGFSGPYTIRGQLNLEATGIPQGDSTDHAIADPRDFLELTLDPASGSEETIRASAFLAQLKPGDQARLDLLARSSNFASDGRELIVSALFSRPVTGLDDLPPPEEWSASVFLKGPGDDFSQCLSPTLATTTAAAYEPPLSEGYVNCGGEEAFGKFEADNAVHGEDLGGAVASFGRDAESEADGPFADPDTSRIEDDDVPVEIFRTGRKGQVAYKANVVPGRYEVRLYWSDASGAVDASGQSLRLFDVCVNFRDVLTRFSPATAAAKEGGDPRQPPCNATFDAAICRRFELDVTEELNGNTFLRVDVKGLGPGEPPGSAFLNGLCFKRLGPATGERPSGDVEDNSPAPPVPPPAKPVFTRAEDSEDEAAVSGVDLEKAIRVETDVAPGANGAASGEVVCTVAPASSGGAQGWSVALRHDPAGLLTVSVESPGSGVTVTNAEFRPQAGTPELADGKPVTLAVDYTPGDPATVGVTLAGTRADGSPYPPTVLAKADALDFFGVGSVSVRPRNLILSNNHILASQRAEPPCAVEVAYGLQSVPGELSDFGLECVDWNLASNRNDITTVWGRFRVDNPAVLFRGFELGETGARAEFFGLSLCESPGGSTLDVRVIFDVNPPVMGAAGSGHLGTVILGAQAPTTASVALDDGSIEVAGGDSIGPGEGLELAATTAAFSGSNQNNTRANAIDIPFTPGGTQEVQGTLAALDIQSGALPRCRLNEFGGGAGNGDDSGDDDGLLDPIQLLPFEPHDCDDSEDCSTCELIEGVLLGQFGLGAALIGSGGFTTITLPPFPDAPTSPTRPVGPPLRNWFAFDPVGEDTLVRLGIEAGTGRLVVQVFSLAEPGVPALECVPFQEVLKLRADPEGAGAGTGTSRTFRFLAEAGKEHFIVVSGDEPGDFVLSLSDVTSEAGGQVPGDCNQDGLIDISDPVCVFSFLFLGAPSRLPCGDGSSRDAANRRAFDCTGDGAIDLSDGLCLLGSLFLGGPPHVLGTTCQPLVGCGKVCAP